MNVASNQGCSTPTIDYDDCAAWQIESFACRPWSSRLKWTASWGYFNSWWKSIFSNQQPATVVWRSGSSYPAALGNQPAANLINGTTKNMWIPTQPIETQQLEYQYQLLLMMVQKSGDHQLRPQLRLVGKNPNISLRVLCVAGGLAVWGPVLRIPGIPENERDCYLEVPRFESQTTN